MNKKVFACLVTIFTTTAQALMPCQHASAFTSLREMQQSLRKDVVLIGPSDDRKPIDSNSETHLSLKEQKQARSSVGHFYCPAGGSETSASGIATVIIKNNEIATVAHALETPDGSLRKNIADCFFINYANPSIRHYLEISSIKRRSPSTDPTEGDYAVFYVKPPVADAQPYGVDRSGRSVKVGQEMIMVSKNIANRAMQKEPKAQSCHVQEASAVDKFGNSTFKSDCDAEGGDSGSPMLVRVQNQLLFKGMHRGEPWDGQNNCKFDSEHCYSQATELAGPFLDAL